jgi:hypothetical protein
VIGSFWHNVLVTRQGNRWRLRWQQHWTSNFRAAVAIAINITIAIAIEEAILQPYLIQLYDQNLGKIWQLAGASGIGFFLTIWHFAGVRHQAGDIAGFVGFSALSILLFLEGFRIIPLW